MHQSQIQSPEEGKQAIRSQHELIQNEFLIENVPHFQIKKGRTRLRVKVPNCLRLKI